MSKGGGTTTSTTSNTLDPQIKALLTSNYNSASSIANQPFTPYTGEQVAGFTPTGIQAQDLLKSIGTGTTGDGALNQAVGTTQGVAGYTPQSVTAGQLSNTDLSPYMNPYQSDVIDATLKQLGQARDTSMMSDNQRASAAGAFGGDRQAVLNSLTNKNYLDTAGSTLAGLNSQNFTQAQGAATSDLNRSLSAAQGNQSAGLSGAGLNLQAGSQLGQLSQQQLAQAVTKGGLLGAVGDAQQGLQQSKDDAAYQEFLRKLQYPIQGQTIKNQALGLIPNVTNSSTSGTQPGQSQLGGIGSALSGIAAIGGLFSDVRLKHDIRTVRHDGRGRRWVTFRYNWDPETVHTGVIAQEVALTDPRAVSPTLFGLAVDYSQLEEAA